MFRAFLFLIQKPTENLKNIRAKGAADDFRINFCMLKKRLTETKRVSY
jgi:hypothetical protein